MRTKYLSAAALVCASVYVLALALASYRVFKMVSFQQAQAKRDFIELVDRASSAAVLGFMDEAFRETVRDALRSSGALAAAIVTGPSGPEYAVERGPGYLANIDGGPRFAMKLGATRSPLFAPLHASNVRNATVSATALLVDDGRMVAILRDSLAAIAAAAMIGALLLTIDVIRAPASAPSAEPITAVTAMGATERPRTRGEHFDPDIPDLSSDVRPGASPASASVPGSEAPPDSPAGLYSPRGGVGWEEYAAERLDAELHRCASFEQDLVLLAAAPLRGGDGWEELYPVFAESAVSFFTFKDLVFERREGGISVILPNVDLGHGLRMAEEFRRKLGRDQKGPLADVDIRIGLTSRSGRLVDAERLMMEASRALEKAIHEASAPVVAFKPDPERYRSFIAARS